MVHGEISLTEQEFEHRDHRRLHGISCHAHRVDELRQHLRLELLLDDEHELGRPELAALVTERATLRDILPVIIAQADGLVSFQAAQALVELLLGQRTRQIAVKKGVDVVDARVKDRQVLEVLQ